MSGLPNPIHLALTPAYAAIDAASGVKTAADNILSAAGLPNPIHYAIRTLDSNLAKVSLVAEDVAKSFAPLPTIADDYSDDVKKSLFATGIDGIRAQIQRGLPLDLTNPDIIAAMLDALETKTHVEEGLDDRKMALEYVMVLLSRLPDGQAQRDLEHKAIKLLYFDLPHPPSTHMGDKYAFRTPDGSFNNLSNPDIGRAGTPYSRSCTGLRPMPADELPDPGLLFDALEKRDGFVPHPAGLNGLFFNFATSVIHSVFRTSRTDWNINETSSYVDLGILYGNTAAHQEKTRFHTDDGKLTGRGRLYEDVFAETRVLNLPPGVSAILICFCRNHNYIADTLLAINEKKRWVTEFPKKDTPEDIQKQYDEVIVPQDDQIFNTARLINSVMYANVVLGDYLAAILGTVRELSPWTLNISGERREADHTLLERGQGNSCSVEFNVLYRLHPSMSEDDAEYTETAFGFLFPDAIATNFANLTVDEFEKRLSVITATTRGVTPDGPPDAKGKPTFTEAQLDELKDDSKPTDYRKYPLHGFKRDPVTKKMTATVFLRDANGRFDDAQLADALLTATSVPGGAFKARGVPGVMKVIEMLGISQARTWGACTMNEFRRFLGLRAYKTFEEWNPDPKIAQAARKLYHNIENLELYIGLVSEESKQVMDGAGLCPSFTMSRAILADAVALVRGDRHLTYDLTPFNLTSWGFAEASRNTKNAGYGGILGRILARALPNHYNNSSTYTHFPLMTPQAMKAVFEKKGKLSQYSLERPIPTLPIVTVSEPTGIYGLSAQDATGIRTTYGQNVRDIIPGNTGFFSSVDFPDRHAADAKTIQDLVAPASSLKATGQWFHDRTIQLIREKSYSVTPGTKIVDVVRDVLRLVPVHWGATEVAGLPLKTTFEPRGILFEQELYQYLKEIYSFIYLEADVTLKIPQRAEAKGNVDRLLRFIKLGLFESRGGIASSVASAVASLVLGDGQNAVHATLKRFLSSGKSVDEIANDILAVITTVSIEFTQTLNNVVNFYLQDIPEIAPHKEAIINASKVDSPENSTLLQGYVREALRLDPAVPYIYREATFDGVAGPVTYTKGQKLALDLTALGKDKRMFRLPPGTKPEYNIDPARPIESYALLQGDGLFKALGQDFVYTTAAQTLRAIFSLKNVRAGPGGPGNLRRFKLPVNGIPVYHYQDQEDANRLTQWVTSRTIQYDA